MGSNEDVPTPPWRKARKPVPLKPQLSQDLIVETGLRIMDAEGLDGLSMRRVAQELDTGPASLYAHVANKEELLELIYDRVLGEIRLAEPDPARWKEQLRDYAMEWYRVLGSHADVARAGLANIPTGPNALRISEHVFGMLIDAGMPPRDAALAVDRLALYISGDAFEGSLHFAKIRAAGLSMEEYFTTFVGTIESYYRSLPPERFPHITKHLDDLMAGDGRARFEYGLDLLLDGLEARMP